MKTPTGSTCNAGARKVREGFTLVELLVVIGIIVLLAGLITPAVVAARAKFKVSGTRVEIKALEAAMVAYLADWGVYPADDRLEVYNPVTEEMETVPLESARCLVHYLGTTFRTDAPVGSVERSRRNSGPYFEFPANRLVPPVNGRFIDLIGRRADYTAVPPEVDYYQFDNNDADNGSKDWLTAWDPLKQYNVSNVHPTAVDIWSAGQDVRDDVSANNPSNDDSPPKDLGDDIGNW